MSQKVTKNSDKLAGLIKSRRTELGLTIEEAASRAGVGTKTWCRYEAGESIRTDKISGICKALNWMRFPDMSDDDLPDFDLEEYKSHKAWSRSISERFGDMAALAFATGSDILLDHLREDLDALSSMPKDAHIGQLKFSWLQSILPEQFLTRYNYEFIYCLKTTVLQLRKVVKFNDVFYAHSVIDELAFYLIIEEASLFMDSISVGDDAHLDLDAEDWESWIFDLFDDMDIVTWLYSDSYVTSEHIYHFDHWLNEQFFVDY